MGLKVKVNKAAFELNWKIILKAVESEILVKNNRSAEIKNDLCSELKTADCSQRWLWTWKSKNFNILLGGVSFEWKNYQKTKWTTFNLEKNLNTSSRLQFITFIYSFVSV